MRLLVRRSASTKLKYTYSYIIEKMPQRLANWKAKILSLAGRITLCKSVLAMVPLYPMQSALLPESICNEIERIFRRFIWADSTEKKAIHLIKWSTLCQPKLDGGIGTRNMQSMNKAFVMKLGWGILHDSDSLWASVLRSKYIRTQEGTDQVHAKGRDSPLWKAICKVLPDVITGTAWSVRNGRNVKFWSDKWLENFGPLIQYVPQVSSVNNINAAVMDMVSPNNQWCWEAFAHLLHVQVVMRIASYQPPATDMKEDTRFWGSSASGKFTVKSAYQMQEQPCSNPRRKDPT